MEAPIHIKSCGLIAMSCIHVHLANTGSWFTKLRFICIQLKLATLSAEKKQNQTGCLVRVSFCVGQKGGLLRSFKSMLFSYVGVHRYLCLCILKKSIFRTIIKKIVITL